MGEYKDFVYTISHSILKKHNIKSGDRMSAAAEGLLIIGMEAFKKVGLQSIILERNWTIRGYIILQINYWSVTIQRNLQ